MKINIKSEPTEDIPVRNLKPGQLAVITTTACDDTIFDRRGSIVHVVRGPRDIPVLQIVGGDLDDCWDPVPQPNHFRVRVLRPDTLLEVR